MWARMKELVGRPPPLPSSAVWDPAEPWRLPRDPTLRAAPHLQPPTWAIIMSSSLFAILTFVTLTFCYPHFLSSWLVFSRILPLYFCLQGSAAGGILPHDHSLFLLEKRVLAFQGSSWREVNFRHRPVSPPKNAPLFRVIDVAFSYLTSLDWPRSRKKLSTCAPQSLDLVILGALLAFKGLFQLLIVRWDLLHHLDWEMKVAWAPIWSLMGTNCKRMYSLPCSASHSLLKRRIVNYNVLNRLKHIMATEKCELDMNGDGYKVWLIISHLGYSLQWRWVDASPQSPTHQTGFEYFLHP